MATSWLRFKVQFLRYTWKILLRTPVLWRLHALSCPGHEPALCWIPAEPYGYYRGGILIQACVRLRSHPGRCLATINHYGFATPTYFTPSRREQDASELH